MKEEKLYTLEEVAAALHITRQAVYNNIRKGYLSFTKYGKSYLVSESQLKDLLKNGYGRRKGGTGKKTVTNK